jgi:RNA polymerase sigma factor (sigma-70 family)
VLAPNPDQRGRPAPQRRRWGGGSLFRLAPSLEVVATSAAENFDRQRIQSLLEWLLRNGRREKLCAEVAQLTAAPHALVEDVFQEVCLKASRRGDCRGESPGEVYSWLRTATLNRVRDELKGGFERYELLVDWRDEQRQPHDSGAGADAEVLDREKRHELGELVETALAELNERQRKVAVLHAYGFKNPEIARQLRVTRRQVQRLKEQMLAGARDALAAHAGAGCDRGDSLVRRLAFGLADPSEHTEAELHMASCVPCAAVYRRLELWHDKVAALAPVPAAAHDPGLIERTLHKTTNALASLKQHATDAGAQAKQQLADAGSQVKQHAAAGYGRAVEYTPLAGARPGAAATAIAGCLALGGGAATYCIEKGVDPFDGFGRDRPADVADATQDRPKRSRQPSSRPTPHKSPPRHPRRHRPSPLPSQNRLRHSPRRRSRRRRPPRRRRRPHRRHLRRLSRLRPRCSSASRPTRRRPRPPEAPRPSPRPPRRRVGATYTDHDSKRRTDAHHRPCRPAGSRLRARLAAGRGGARRRGHL